MDVCHHRIKTETKFPTEIFINCIISIESTICPCCCESGRLLAPAGACELNQGPHRRSAAILRRVSKHGRFLGRTCCHPSRPLPQGGGLVRIRAEISSPLAGGEGLEPPTPAFCSAPQQRTTAACCYSFSTQQTERNTEWPRPDHKTNPLLTSPLLAIIAAAHRRGATGAALCRRRFTKITTEFPKSY